LALHDDLTVALTPADIALEVRAGDLALQVPSGPDNLVVRALRRPARRVRGGGDGGAYAPSAEESEEAPVRGMVVMEMRTHGFLRISDADGTREEPLPDSPLAAGEFPMGLWVAADHTVFAVGKQYTGQPGPDDGVVWRRAPGGGWSTAHRARGRVFGAIAGRSSDEVVVGGIGGIACFDGATWRETKLPYPMMWKVWREADEIVAQAWDGSAAFTVRGGVVTGCAPRGVPEFDRYTCTVEGTQYFVFDRSEEVGERSLSASEEREIRGEMAEVQRIVAASERRG